MLLGPVRIEIKSQTGQKRSLLRMDYLAEIRERKVWRITWSPSPSLIAILYDSNMLLILLKNYNFFSRAWCHMGQADS